ncbi:hypothetical protein GCM10023310_36390 [Paenibacillus vulneris]|uniref:LysM peptidoglycan-binding domain-containing protein n=1 Tax=Paenibacillus vulneris TaxID=1133364 RepID=A0ABW3UMM1_9BACL
MKIHMVKKGESLYLIAQKYHVDLDKLIEMNPQITDPNVIDVGMKVKIPNGPTPVEPADDFLYKHTVVQGDTLWKLSKAWNIPLNQLIEANPQLKNPNVLMTGDIVNIPKAKHQQGDHHYPHHHHKKNTAPIQPAPTPVSPIQTAPAPKPPEHIEAPKPNVEMPIMPIMPIMPMAPNVNEQISPEAVMPNVNQQPFIPEMQVSPSAVQPNVNQQPFVPEMQVSPSAVQPNVNQQPFFPEMQVSPSEIQPNVNQQPFFPEMPVSPSAVQPNVNQQPFFPEMPVSPSAIQPSVNQQPYIPEMPIMPSATQPAPSFMPNAPQPYPSVMPSYEQPGVNSAISPFSDNANVMGAEATPNAPFHQPSSNLFEQFQVPATEAMSYGQMSPNYWPQQEMPMMWPQQEQPYPPMQQMPGAEQMPYQPFAAPMPEMYGFIPQAGGGCGCGGEQVSPAYEKGKPFPNVSPMESPYMFQPEMPSYPNAPFPGMTYPTSVSPESEAPYYQGGFFPQTAGAFTGPAYPMYGYQMPSISSYGGGYDDCGCDDTSIGREQPVQAAEEEAATVSRNNQKSEPKSTNKKKRGNQAVISRISHTPRRRRASSSKSNKSPWINV